jgi:hypothetical protein
LLRRRSSRGALLLLWLLLPASAFGADWELRAEEDGIRVYTRPVPGSPVAAMRAEITILAPVDALLGVLMDAGKLPEWFPNCPTARVLSQQADVQLRYVVTAAPWPVDSRDAIYRYRVSRDANAGSATIRVDVAPDAHPRQEGYVRVLEAEGRWRLVPAEDATKVTWEMHLDPGGSLPAWLVNRRLVETPLGALRGLRSQVTGAR